MGVILLPMGALLLLAPLMPLMDFILNVADFFQNLFNIGQDTGADTEIDEIS